MLSIEDWFILFSFLVLAVGISFFSWKKYLTYFVKKEGTIHSPKTPIQSFQSKSGLGVEILREGQGEGAKKKNRLTVDYVARLEDGTQVDSSQDHGRSLTFTLGAKEVIDGWEEGLKGAKVGEKRIVKVPSRLAYGSQGTKKIPPNATIYFEIEVLRIDS